MATGGGKQPTFRTAHGAPPKKAWQGPIRAGQWDQRGMFRVVGVVLMSIAPFDPCSPLHMLSKRGRFRTAPIIALVIPGMPLKTTHPQKDPFKTASGVQNAGPWDPWLPVVENSQLFAQPVHSARCAPKGGGGCRFSCPGRSCGGRVKG